MRCKHNGWDFEKSTGYPKIIFKRNIFSVEEIEIPKNKIPELKDIFSKTVEYKKQLIDYEKELSKFEENGYNIRFNNNYYTVLKTAETNKFESILERRYIEKLGIDSLSQEIQHELRDRAEKDFLENYIKGKEAQALISDLRNYKNVDAKIHVGYKKNYSKYQDSGIYFDLGIYNGIIYSVKLMPDKDNFSVIIETAKEEINRFTEKYNTVINLVNQINNCKNGFWKASLIFDNIGILQLEIDQTYIKPSEWNMTKERINLSDRYLSSDKILCNTLVNKMKLVMKNMERYGYRVMGVCQ